jgi:hypothetical protein
MCCRQNDQTAILLRFFVPDEFADPQTNTLRLPAGALSLGAFLALPASRPNNKTDLLLTFKNIELSVNYISSVTHELTGRDTQLVWRAVYVFGEVNTAALDW